MRPEPKNSRRPLPVRAVPRPGRGMESPGFCPRWHEQPVRVVGRPICAEIERTSDLEKIDHVWITLGVPEVGAVQLAVNTRSLRNSRAGFDPRVRIGVSRQPCHRQPVPGVYPARLLDYAVVETNANVFYETMERREAEDFLLGRAARAGMIQAWGMAFCRRWLGVHQIHSRRASCGVPVDLRGMDGALRFFYQEEEVAELVLLKFCGQP